MRILLVEDEAMIGLAARDALTDAGHDVIGPFGSFSSAILGIAQTTADVALVDINLSGREDGPDLARRLLSDFGIPSLFASSQPQTAHANKDAAIGLLQKPYSEEALVATVGVLEAVLAGRKPPPPAFPAGLAIF